MLKALAAIKGFLPYNNDNNDNLSRQWKKQTTAENTNYFGIFDFFFQIMLGLL